MRFHPVRPCLRVSCEATSAQVNVRFSEPEIADTLSKIFEPSFESPDETILEKQLDTVATFFDIPRPELAAEYATFDSKRKDEYKAQGCRPGKRHEFRVSILAEDEDKYKHLPDICDLVTLVNPSNGGPERDFASLKFTPESESTCHSGK